ncbi:hypothetical protein [Pseudomonas sp. PSB11]|uniref:hypothetical protein n=1 Tax=Pseudomonas sp. PSB11 TaxID=2021969 RepID=UPI00166146C9|nr:hypothetical protein [Pseudomonas sp. PSB11]MBD0682681.1 hypothetical protein [Pseudomonas sp. PSB11]
MSLFAPPSLFAQVALAARADADLPDGVHLRLLPSPLLGFPVAPFGIWRVTPDLAEPEVLWRDRGGRVLPEPSLEAAGGVLIADIARPQPESDVVDVAVELLVDGFEGRVELIGRVGHRVLATRSRAPFIVGGPQVERVRIIGRGRVLGLRTWRVDGQRVIEPLIGQEPVALLSLPIEGEWPWYARGLGEAEALRRVEEGAARRLQAPDRPDGPLDALTPADDVARVSAHLAAIIQECKTMVGDIETVPRAQRLKRDIPKTPELARRQIVDVGISDDLLLKAQDPGIGRSLGLVGTLREHSDGSQPLAYVALGLFVLRPASLARDGRDLATALGPRHPALERIESVFSERVGAGRMLQGIGKRYMDALAAAEFVLPAAMDARGLLAVAGAVPPADPPSLSAPSLGEASWLEGHGQPSTTFRQEFVFSAPPLGALAALGRREGGGWVTRHQAIDLAPPANPDKRAVALLLGTTQPKPRGPGRVAMAGLFERRGLIADAPIADSAPPVRYRAALADFFGRFGATAEFDVPAPPRPRPPKPAPQTRLVLNGPEGMGGPPASPGRIEVRVQVPSVADLAAGSLHIARLEGSIDGVPLPPLAIVPVAADETRVLVQPIPLPELTVGKTGSALLAFSFVDSAGQASDEVTLTVSYVDRRRPAVVPTGLGLLWTSRPGPTPEVEVKLRWPGEAGTRYRAYIADAQSLEVTGPTRAAIALTGGQRDRVGALGGRERFRLLTEPPLETVDGVVTLDERLPRSLASVQFLRIVPVSGQGREAEFERCGVVPLAVPGDRAPPPPRVSVQVDARHGKATVRVQALGLDLVELQANEPGLFDNPPDATAAAPEFRLRSASAEVPDPVYAREIARGALRLERDGDTVAFVAEVEDPTPLPPFVSHTYWAEVRMPSERRLAPGIVEIAPAGAVQPVIDSQRQDMPRPYSGVSAPASAMHVPTLPVPPIEAPAAVVVDAGAGVTYASLTASATPAALSRAIAPYRLRIWQQWGDQAIGPAEPDVELDSAPLQWQGGPAPAGDHPLPLRLHLMIIDPLGREGDVVTAEAT